MLTDSGVDVVLRKLKNTQSHRLGDFLLNNPPTGLSGEYSNRKFRGTDAWLSRLLELLAVPDVGSGR